MGLRAVLDVEVINFKRCWTIWSLHNVFLQLYNMKLENGPVRETGSMFRIFVSWGLEFACYFRYFFRSTPDFLALLLPNSSESRTSLFLFRRGMI